ncbi:MAG: tripartite tricarboxylate transporter TctB family protein [Acetobacteraceae bacterium]|nr:tripartite tricarboxylate transporter TctB family protein [Acetobacteraceae bacterium]
MRVSDTLSGGICVLAGAALAWHAAGFPKTAVQAYGPGFFPELLGMLLGICGVLLIVRGVSERQPITDLPAWTRSPAAWARVALIPACVVAYLELAPRIGFLGAATIPTAIMLAILSRRPWLSLLVAAGSAVAIWLMFAKLLLVPLPAGPLEMLLA